MATYYCKTLGRLKRQKIGFFLLLGLLLPLLGPLYQLYHLGARVDILQQIKIRSLTAVLRRVCPLRRCARAMPSALVASLNVLCRSCSAISKNRKRSSWIRGACATLARTLVDSPSTLWSSRWVGSLLLCAREAAVTVVVGVKGLDGYGFVLCVVVVG